MCPASVRQELPVLRTQPGVATSEGGKLSLPTPPAQEGALGWLFWCFSSVVSTEPSCSELFPCGLFSAFSGQVFMRLILQQNQPLRGWWGKSQPAVCYRLRGFMRGVPAQVQRGGHTGALEERMYEISRPSHGRSWGHRTCLEETTESLSEREEVYNCIHTFINC